MSFRHIPSFFFLKVPWLISNGYKIHKVITATLSRQLCSSSPDWDFDFEQTMGQDILRKSKKKKSDCTVKFCRMDWRLTKQENGLGGSAAVQPELHGRQTEGRKTRWIAVGAEYGVEQITVSRNVVVLEHVVLVYIATTQWVAFDVSSVANSEVLDGKRSGY